MTVAKPTINVKEFGAVGDGVTNDTTAIQNAINSATDNSILVFPNGSFGITGQIVITGKSLILEGFGESSIKELSANTATGSAGALILVSGSSASNTRIQNLNCDGAETLVTFSALSGTSEREFCFVRFNSVDEGSIFNCTVNGKRWGVIVDTCTNFLVDGLNFNGILTTPATGTAAGSDNYNSGARVKAGNKISIRNSIAKNCGSLVLAGVNDSSIDPTRVTTIGCHVENAWDNGVYYSSAQESIVSDCSVLTSNGSGIKVRGSNNQVNNNQVKSCNVGIGFSGAGASPDQYNKTGHGIIISNNRIESIATDGISIDTNTYRTRDVQIVNNYLNSVSTSGGGYGAIRGEADRISILGNIINSASGQYGIILAGTSGDILKGLNISNNTFLNCSGDAINLNYINYSNIIGNTFQDIYGDGIECVNTTGLNIGYNKFISGISGTGIVATSGNSNFYNNFYFNDGTISVDQNTNSVVSTNSSGVIGIGTSGVPSSARLHIMFDSANVDAIKLQDSRPAVARTWSIGPNVGVNNTFTFRDSNSSTNVLSLFTAGGASLKGDFTLNTAGNGFIITEGSNATMGTGVLVGGTVTISTTKVTAVSRIFLTSQVDGGTPGFLRVSARTAATSFTITSSSGTDTSTVAWLIVEPA